MKHNILIILLILFFSSCGANKQISRKYMGKPISYLGGELGAPKSVIDQNGEKIYIYEIKEKLKSAEINQGKLTLDPIVSPKVLKTERYYFTVKDNVVTKVRMEEEYDR